MNLALRQATLADVDVVAQFNAALAWESENKKLDPVILARGVRAVLGDPHKGFYTLAERNDEVIGQVLVTFEWSDWRNGWYWWIQSVYVREDARRGGVFRTLYEHLLAAAAADPTVIGLRLYVEHNNERARQTYQTLGMSEEGYLLMGLYPLPGKGSIFGMKSEP